MSNLAANDVSLGRHNRVLLIWGGGENQEPRTEGRKEQRCKKSWKTGSEGEEGEMEKEGGKGVVLLYGLLAWLWQRGEAGHKVEKTVSITPGTHRRIICWGWVNCDLRSVMTCNNFLSLLSVSRQGRSSQQGEGCRDVGHKPNKWEGTNCVMWEATTTIKSIIKAIVNVPENARAGVGLQS